MNTKTLIAFAVTLLAGCTTVGPNFQPPAAQTRPAIARPVRPSAAKARRCSATGGRCSVTRSSTSWRPRLCKPAHAGAAAARIDRARAALGLARADDGPRVDAGANVTELRTSANSVTTPVLGGKAIAFDGTQTTLQIGAGWELDLWGRVKARDRSRGRPSSMPPASTLLPPALRSPPMAAAYWQWRAPPTDPGAGASAGQPTCGPCRWCRPVRCGRSHPQDLQRARADVGRRRGRTRPIAAAARPWQLHFDCGLTGQGGCRPALAGHAVGRPARRRRWLAGRAVATPPDLAQSLALLHAATAQVGIAEGAFYPSLRLAGSLAYPKGLGRLIAAPSRLYNFGPNLTLPCSTPAATGQSRHRPGPGAGEPRRLPRPLLAPARGGRCAGRAAGRSPRKKAQQRALSASQQALAVSANATRPARSAISTWLRPERGPLTSGAGFGAVARGAVGATAQLVKALGGVGAALRLGVRGVRLVGGKAHAGESAPAGG